MRHPELRCLQGPPMVEELPLGVSAKALGPARNQCGGRRDAATQAFPVRYVVLDEAKVGGTFRGTSSEHCPGGLVDPSSARGLSVCAPGHERVVAVSLSAVWTVLRLERGRRLSDRNLADLNGSSTSRCC